MTNTESKISIWYHTIDSMLTAQEKESLIMTIELLLAERTEQCAKVLQDRMNYLKSFDYKERITTTRGDASTIYNELNSALFQIRAINRPETKS